MSLRGIVAVAVMGLLGAAVVVGYTALAWGQPNFPAPGSGMPSGQERRVLAPRGATPSDEEQPSPFPVPVPAPTPFQDAAPEQPPAPEPTPDPAAEPLPPAQEPPLPVAPSTPAAPTLPSEPKPQPQLPQPEPVNQTPQPLPAAAPEKPDPAPATPAPKSRESVAPTSRGPLATHQPSVVLEWNGPANARVGHPSDYSITVRNESTAAVQEVMLRVRIPQGMTVVSVEPQGLSEGKVYAWELGMLGPKQDKTIQLRLLADARGDFNPQAWVTFTGSALAKVQAREPRLVLKGTATERVMVGETASFAFTVSNPGDGPADAVRVHANLTDGLEHSHGKRVDFEVGTLAPGESRSVQIICGTRGGGEQKCEGFAEAEGGLKTQHSASVHVVTPRLELSVTGPGLRYVDRKASYALKLGNAGDAAATNVSVSDTLSPGLKFVSASDGGRYDPNTRTVSWFVGEVAPGQTREFKVEVLAAILGDQRQQAVALAARGLRVEADAVTRVEGLSALVLDVTDSEDPIEVGGTMAYDVRVSNAGSKTENDVRVVCQIPDKMEFKGAQGPVRYRQEGNSLVFEPVASLAPKGEVQLRLTVKPLIAGDARFTLQVTSGTMQDPIIEMEATRIYSDAPGGR